MDRHDQPPHPSSPRPRSPAPPARPAAGSSTDSRLVTSPSVLASALGTPPFDWDRPETWPALLDGVDAGYIAYSPDLTMPGAVDTVGRFCAAAVDAGVDQLVLLAGRGEPEAEAAEEVVRDSGARWTIVRASWFAQNFSEGLPRRTRCSRQIALPAGDVARALRRRRGHRRRRHRRTGRPGHDGRTYDVTGPRLLTFADAAAESPRPSGRPLTYVDVSPADFSPRRSTTACRSSLPRAGELCETRARRAQRLRRPRRRGGPRPPAADFRDFAVRAAAGALDRRRRPQVRAMSGRPVATGAAAVGSGLVGECSSPSRRSSCPRSGASRRPRASRRCSRSTGRRRRSRSCRSRHDRGRVGRRRDPHRAEP